MLPEKLHTDQIKRFHSTLTKLSERIDQEPNETKQGELSMHYYHLVKLWNKIDDFIEYTVKSNLDQIDSEIKKI